MPGLYTLHPKHKQKPFFTLGPQQCAWAQSLMADLEKVCKDHREMRCYKLGLGLDTFRMVALTKHFRKLESHVLQAAYAR